MAETLVLQDWTTINRKFGVNVVQSPCNWLDLAAYRDVVVIIEVKGITNSPVLNINTGPARE